jgi:UDP-N-acetyl-D-mannosaminuronic acid transferase (WecB/TagA/CpsF family)
MATYERIDYGSDDGAQLGGAATDKIGFYGATPVVRPTKATAVTTTGASSTTNAYGYTTAAQADAIVTAVNAIIVNLTTLGLTT